MTAPYRWTFRSFSAAAFLAAIATASPAQVVVQPKAGPGPVANGQSQPKALPFPQPLPPPQPIPLPGSTAKKPSVYVMPQINSWPGIPMAPFYQQTPMLFNPALNNPWMNQVIVTPVEVNPFMVNTLLMNHFAVNPALLNQPFNNPFGVPRFGPVSPFSPLVAYTPPIAIQQPGQLMFQGPDLQVNPTSGTVYQPLTGRVTLADGSTFYRVPGSGLPTATGNYSVGTGLYYNPQGGTFFNPASGVLSKPGQTNIFMPYVW